EQTWPCPWADPARLAANLDLSGEPHQTYRGGQCEHSDEDLQTAGAGGRCVVHLAAVIRGGRCRLVLRRGPAPLRGQGLVTCVCGHQRFPRISPKRSYWSFTHWVNSSP